MKKLLVLGGMCLAGCVGTATTSPMALIEMDINGSPIIKPGGPFVYVDGVYRGNPVDSQFRIWLTAGEHEVGLHHAGTTWKKTFVVTDQPTHQKLVVRYGDAK
jgi:hypothetical protein